MQHQPSQPEPSYEALLVELHLACQKRGLHITEVRRLRLPNVALALGIKYDDTLDTAYDVRQGLVGFTTTPGRFGEQDVVVISVLLNIHSNDHFLTRRRADLVHRLNVGRDRAKLAEETAIANLASELHRHFHATS